MLDWRDPRERIKECREQALAWLAIGEDEAARRMLKQTLHVSVAIGEGDFQLDSWIRWLGRVNELEPEKAQERVEWFSRAVAAIRETDGPAAEAAQELLEVTFKWSPRRAVKMFRWFLSQRLVNYEDGLRALLARRALFHVVSDLVDGGALSCERLAQLEWCLRFYDPLLLLARPRKRPPEISAMDDEGRYAVSAGGASPPADDWFIAVRERTPDGDIVLAEETTLKRLDMEQPGEVRQSVVSLEGTPAPETDAESFFYQGMRLHVSDYPVLRPNPSMMPLIISHYGRSLESPGDRWLALNPIIGRELGLTLTSRRDASFAWDDTEGRTVIWSE